eukprot:Amastigsp_a178021_123.p2 type:complete len:218 gc:universal Amastigsp_a178021_123:212-865(+)
MASAARSGARPPAMVVPEAEALEAALLKLKARFPDYGVRRLAKVVQEENPKWTVTERRVGKIMKKKALTIRTDVDAPKFKRSVLRNSGIAILASRERFALHVEVAQFFAKRGLQRDAEDLAWLVTNDDETLWLEALAANPRLINDESIRAALRDGAHVRNRGCHQYHATVRLLESIQRDGPVGLLSFDSKHASGRLGSSADLADAGSENDSDPDDLD